LQFRYRGSRRESAVAQLSTLGHIHALQQIHIMKKFISPKAIHLAAVFLLLITNRSIGSGWQGSDNFSSGIASSNWPIDKVSEGQMTVAGVNGHVSFLVPVSTTADQNGYIGWHGTPTAAEDWIVEITGHDSAGYSSGSSSQLQFAVVDTASLSSTVRGYRVSKRSAVDSSFSAAQWIGSGYTTTANVSSTSVDFLLRLVYHSASQQIEAWYDPTASGQGWTRLDTISLANFSPSMTASSTFTFAIFANTSYGPISEGDIWADNFRAMPPPPPLIVSGAQLTAKANVLHLTLTNNGSLFQLQSAGALTGGWSTVSTPWTTNAGWVSTSVTNSSPVQFYRLQPN
jgi:hypothetical protein